MKFLPTLLLASSFAFSMSSFANEQISEAETHAHAVLDSQATDAVAADTAAVIVTTQDDLANIAVTPTTESPQPEQAPSQTPPEAEEEPVVQPQE